MKRLFLFHLLLAMTVCASASAAPAPASIQRIAQPAQSGVAASVRVADQPLVFTGLVTAPAGPSSGTPQGGGEAAEADAALRELGRVLGLAGSDPSRVARLHAYAASEDAARAAEKAVATQFATTPVALTLLRTPLSGGALVAFEAVALSDRATDTVTVVEARAAILPAGGKIFISGQAERGADLGSAVKLTMIGLHRSVAYLGLKKTDIVQVKAFIRPFADHAAATREIAASFDRAPVPPVVLMEWESTLFAEIELVVSARALPAPAADEPIGYAWFPWLAKSPRYSHVGFVSAGTPLIFLGAVESDSPGDARAQMKTVFERIGSALYEAGSSYRNLAKATYYLTDSKARTVLGDIRGVYFDPTRPPAASALEMKAPAHAGRAAAIDLVAVPVK